MPLEISEDGTKTAFNHLSGSLRMCFTHTVEITKPTSYVRIFLLLPYYFLTGAERETATGGLGSVNKGKSRVVQALSWRQARLGENED